jgi:hypothetical protein
MSDVLLLGNETLQYQAWVPNYIIQHKFTCLVSGSLKSIRVYVGGSTNVKVALYADSAGEPGAKLGENTGQACVVGWNTLNLATPVAVTQGTVYHIADNTDSTGSFYLTGTGVCKFKASTYSNALPDPAGSGYTTQTNKIGCVAGYGTPDAPHIDSIGHPYGALAGGTSITITGTGFTEATAVKFGTTDAASYNVDSATQITAVSPAHAAGVVDISITSALGTSATVAADRFKYTDAKKIPFRLPSYQVICDGNSMTAGTGAFVGQAYPDLVLAALGSRWTLHNFGVPGQATTSMIADAATQIDPLFSTFYALNVVCCWEGVNDICGNDNGTTSYNHLVTYCQARQAAGFKVVILTITPQSHTGPGDFETQRSTCNGLIRANWATFSDALADVAADSRIGDAGDELDATYYIDRIHMYTAGYAIVADIVSTAIQGLL